MPEEITVTYDGKAFHPEKTLNLEPNTRYTIQIISTPETVETTEKNAWDLLEEMAGNLPGRRGLVNRTRSLPVWRTEEKRER